MSDGMSDGGDSGQRAAFESLLFPPGHAPGPDCPAPGDFASYAADLNLDQVAEAMAAGWEEQELVRSIFSCPTRDPDVIAFRQDVFCDLEDDALVGALTELGEQLRRVRGHLAALHSMRSPHHRNGWHLDAIAIYCGAVRSLGAGLRAVPLRSVALVSFRAFLDAYTASPGFSTLEQETGDQRAALGAIRYCVRVRGLRVEVSRYDGEPDYSAAVLHTFERFKQGATKDYRVGYRGWPGMNHVGEQILDLVARLFSEELSSLEAFCARHREFYDASVRRFEREVQFFLAYLALVRPIRAAGLAFCYPEVGRRKDVHATGTYDLALAHTLVAAGAPVVTNEVRLGGPERVLVVSGPNQGGKTTFARMFGQLHHLGAVGCPVPGTGARLMAFDRMFTHFGREEDVRTMAGKLEEDLVRIRDILAQATTDSIVVMNEVFSSTALRDATFLGTKVLEKVVQLDLLAVYVTFVDELASFGPSVVSMVSTIVPGNPAERTFKVVRGPADGLAYAMAIAEKHGVTYERLRARVGS